MSLADIQAMKALKIANQNTASINNAQLVNQNINLFNSSTVTTDNYVSNGNGNLIASTGFISSDYIPIQGGANYSFTACRQMAYYDSTKKFISGLANSPVVNPFSTSVPAPSNSAYVRFSWYPSGDGVTAVQQIMRKVVLTPATPTPILPPTINGVVGQPLQLFFQNILRDNLANYQIQVVCSIGQQNAINWTCTPTTAGTYPLTINVYSQYVNLVATATTNIVVKSASVGSGQNRKIIFIGDSTLNALTATQHLLDILSTDALKATYYGTRGTAPNVHEGRGGWSAGTYMTHTEYTTGAGDWNPFYNTTLNKFDFNYYMTNQAYPVPDYVVIWLGINDMFGANSDSQAQTYINTALSNYDTMVNSIKTYNANIKIGINVTIPPNNSADTWGLAYGTSQQQWRYKRNQHMWIEQLINHYKSTSGVYFISMNSYLDATNGFDATSSSGVHPNTTGYNQMGNTLYYWLKSFEV